MLFKSTASIRLMSIHVLAALAMTGLGACTAPQADAPHSRHHMGQSNDLTAPISPQASPAQGTTSGGSMTGSGTGQETMGAHPATPPGTMQPMDRNAMCSMYRDMRNAPNEQARQSMMDRHMQGMSPDMRRKHMDMMRQQCQ